MPDELESFGEPDASLESDLEVLEGKEDEGEEVEEEAEPIAEDTGTGEEDTDEGTEKTAKKSDKESDEDVELARVSYGEIKKEYPEFFKKFPTLRTAFFREQEFTKIFPNIEDAQGALEAQEKLSNVSEVVASGDAKSIISELKEASDDALQSFSKNFLSTLAETSKDLYIEVTTPVLKHVLRQVLDLGMREKDENTTNAAKLVHRAIFGGSWEGISEPDPKPAEKVVDKKFEEEKQSFYRTKFETLRESIWKDCEREITREIEKGLDPTNALARRPGLKKILVEKVMTEVQRQAGADRLHIAKMDQLWHRERRAGFSGTYKDSIKTAYLSRIKALMPPVRQKIRAEVLGTQKAADKALKDKMTGKETIAVGRHATSKPKQISVKQARDKKMSDMDIILAGAGD